MDKFFNTAAFAQPANGTTGTAGRGIIDCPDCKNVDLGIFRDFRVREGKALQFRGEMSNKFNLMKRDCLSVRPRTSCGLPGLPAQGLT